MTVMRMPTTAGSGPAGGDGPADGTGGDAAAQATAPGAARAGRLR